MKTPVRVINPMRYSDSYINYWGEVYQQRPEIHARGILFESFLFAPREFIRIVEEGRTGQTPETRRKVQQRAVQWTMDDKLERIHLEKVPVEQPEVDLFVASASNQNLIPLRHHAYPRRKPTSGTKALCRLLRNFWRRVMV